MVADAAGACRSHPWERFPHQAVAALSWEDADFSARKLTGDGLIVSGGNRRIRPSSRVHSPLA